MIRRTVAALLLLALTGGLTVPVAALPESHSAVCAASELHPGRPVAAVGTALDPLYGAEQRRVACFPLVRAQAPHLLSRLRPVVIARAYDWRDAEQALLYRHRARRDPGDPPH